MQTITKQQIVEGFEKVFLGNNKHNARRNTTTGHYVLPSIQDAWAGWEEAFKYADLLGMITIVENGNDY